MRTLTNAIELKQKLPEEKKGYCPFSAKRLTMIGAATSGLKHQHLRMAGYHGVCSWKPTLNDASMASLVRKTPTLPP